MQRSVPQMIKYHTKVKTPSFDASTISQSDLRKIISGLVLDGPLGRKASWWERNKPSWWPSAVSFIPPSTSARRNGLNVHQLRKVYTVAVKKCKHKLELVGHEEDNDDDDTQESQDDHESDEQPTSKPAKHSDPLEEVHCKKPDAGYMSEHVEDTDDDPNSDDHHQSPTTEHSDPLADDNFEGGEQARLKSSAKETTAAKPKHSWYCKHCNKRCISENALHLHVVMKHNGALD